MTQPATTKKIKADLCALFDDCFAHDGYADLRVEMRLLKRGQKEVILHCGKQHRYIARFEAAVPVRRLGFADDDQEGAKVFGAL